MQEKTPEARTASGYSLHTHAQKENCILIMPKPPDDSVKMQREQISIIHDTKRSTVMFLLLCRTDSLFDLLSYKVYEKVRL